VTVGLVAAGPNAAEQSELQPYLLIYLGLGKQAGRPADWPQCN